MAEGRRHDPPKKLELVALIDVIFLLLIFFMVTMNIIPGLGQPGKTERQFPIDAPGSGVANVDVLIQLYRYPDNASGQIYYIVVNRTLDELFINVDLPVDPVGLAGHFGSSHFFTQLDDLNPRAMGPGLPPAKTAIIRAGPWIGYSDILEVVKKCRQQRVKPLLTQGVLATLGDVDYGPPRGFITVEP